jgi:rhodanese-related sulfurtransferase
MPMNSDYISPQALYEPWAAGRPPVIIDVRGDAEYIAGHIPGALHIPGDQLPQRLAEIPADQPIVTY